ncbi:MAG: hypothetical protein CVU44_07155 [Chloroflexi bacterium HGW-Chloroflexi-6]|nr:MAG: hypothetical protein CVU44_07155 [Chloroflexi bacterium HGW-Chloroflexi-6]
MKMPKSLVIFFALALMLQLTPLSASAKTTAPQVTPSASVSLSAPSPAVGQVGGDVIFDLVFSATSITPGVSGAEVYVGYDPAFVSPLGSPQTTTEILSGFFGTPNVSINEILPAAQCPGGTQPCIHLVLAGTPQTTQTGFAARFHFRGAAEGATCFSILQSSLVNSDGFAVTHTVGAQQCVTFEYAVDVTGLVTRQGVPANPNTGGGTLSCTSVSATGLATPMQTLNTSSTGAFSLANLALDTFTFRASYPGYLAAQKSGVVLSSSQLNLVLTTISLRGGDVNGDGVINILDVGLIISKFGQTGVAVRSASITCSVVDEPADINDDGRINISDLAILSGNWGQVGPITWP